MELSGRDKQLHMQLQPRRQGVQGEVGHGLRHHKLGEMTWKLTPEDPTNEFVKGGGAGGVS